MKRGAVFDTLVERMTRMAERRAEARKLELAERMKAELPPGIRAEAGPEGVVLSGRGLRRRFALERALRWIRW